MKFLMSVLVYLIVGFVLALGILMAVNGTWWLLIASLIGYVLLFAMIGCPVHE